MRMALLTGGATFLFAFAAHPYSLYAPIHRQNALCATVGLTYSHISVTLPAAPLCCPEVANCTQYLSTSKIDLPRPRRGT